MHIFLTGASGFVGSAVVTALIDAGHSVTGLVRREGAVAAVEAAGATAVVGDVNDPATLAAGVAKADGVIHTAFNHDFSQFAASCEADRRIILTFGDLLAGSDRPLLITSGVGLLPPDQTGETDETARADAEASPRTATEFAADVLAERGVRVGVVRLPPSVHGAGDHGFVPLLIGLARDKGKAAYIGDGANLWGGVHRSDAGRAYALALSHVTPGARFHAVAEAGIPFRQIAQAIGHGLGVPVESLDDEAAVAAHFGWFKHFAGMGHRVSSRWTRATLGWAPTGPGLLEDIANAGYFNS